MSPEQIEQAKAWTRLRGWRWMPGMRAVIPGCTGAGRIVAAGRQVIEPDEEFYTELSCVDIQPRDVPDITDPATLGCLVQLVREITGCSIAVHDPFPTAVRGATVLAQVAVYWPRGKTVVASHYRGATVADAAMRACLDAEARPTWEADHE